MLLYIVEERRLLVPRSVLAEDCPVSIRHPREVIMIARIAGWGRHYGATAIDKDDESDGRPQPSRCARIWSSALGLVFFPQWIHLAV
jgi:hypothetical protein